MIAPEQIAGESEHSQQTAFFCWAALPEIRERYPELRWMHAIPNGGQRNKITASNLMAEGVKAGVADVFLPAANSEFFGLYIEFKAPGKLSNVSFEQDKFRCFVISQGYRWRVFDNWLDAAQCVLEYLD